LRADKRICTNGVLDIDTWEPPKTTFRSRVGGGRSVFGVAAFKAAPSVCVFLTFDPLSLIGFRSFLVIIFVFQLSCPPVTAGKAFKFLSAHGEAHGVAPLADLGIGDGLPDSPDARLNGRDTRRNDRNGRRDIGDPPPDGRDARRERREE
jgi:hypothetical protein